MRVGSAGPEALEVAVNHFVGIDVSLEQSSVCVVDAAGRTVREAKVGSEPDELARYLTGLPLAIAGLFSSVIWEDRRPGAGRG